MTSRGRFTTVGQVLDWWSSRLSQNRSKSPRYRATVASLVDRQLKPRIGAEKIKRLSKATIDDKLVWPMQQVLSPHTVHKALQCLLQALVLAERQRRIDSNPLATSSWKDYWTGKLPPRPAKLKPSDAWTLVPHLCEVFQEDPVAGLLALTMLAHGTRIGETCLQRWDEISLPDRTWTIPGQNTKNGEPLVVPLTDQYIALLSRYRDLQHPARRSSPWVLAMANGERLSDSQASAMFRRISDRRWTSHDLRKLARTTWTEIGIDYLVGELMLNHSMGKLASTYIKTTVDAARLTALGQWHAWLDERGFSAAHSAKSTETSFSEVDA
ncbi:tyrosine-type recombinase/integrase [Pseudomonas sp. PDM13]|uniref:tyrosine-type recombinase/integrase n=1 Tax=Pseudomonas sp. PDM13 TaxID=2769255 RepID=UPI0021DF4A1F|nr:site-specific integrase [Pseudomonas sp. PDM13]MCU9947519.1 site-specific integrase [Pseudomonas sp. PDM13]